jgi:hypothetical protein
MLQASVSEKKERKQKSKLRSTIQNVQKRGLGKSILSSFSPLSLDLALALSLLLSRHGN